jgi:hypothetical protein
MDKRQFLLATALGAPLLCASAGARAGARLSGPALLTVTGAIARSNRGPRDKVLDQLMARHNLQFERAYTFDLAALAVLSQVTIRPTLEYDAKPHELRGPLLRDVLEAAGVATAGPMTLALRAIDGYAPVMTMAEMAARRFIVATRIDGKPLASGGLGPLWAIYDTDRFPETARKPVTERFAQCPWGFYHVDVQPAQARST